jgi:hypothetical protein
MSITMATTRQIRFPWVRGLVAALALGAAGCTVYPATPAQPAYDTDVLPIFLAHCTRCHDNNLDGGLNMPVSAPNMTYVGGPMVGIPLYLTQYGPCSDVDGGVVLCTGAGSPRTVANVGSYIHRTDSLRMPLPPAPPLDEWETKVIDAWVAEKPMPICSNSAHPDPALLCP